jgi:hypothetical protein
MVLRATVAVPATSNAATPATTAIFVFVHAIIFKTPLMRVKVGVEAVAPLANATAAAVFARVAGAH